MADSLSSRPWDGSASRWPDAASYCGACLVDLNDGNGPKTKDACHLPVKEPGSGDYNHAALGAAAAALAGARRWRADPTERQESGGAQVGRPLSPLPVARP